MLQLVIVITGMDRLLQHLVLTIETFTNVAGCDSVHTLVAAINYSNTGTSDVTACDSYNWNGQIITTSGSYDRDLY